MERKWMDLVLERLNRRNAVLFRAQDPLLRPLAETLGQASRLAVARWALEAVKEPAARLEALTGSDIPGRTLAAARCWAAGEITMTVAKRETVSKPSSTSSSVSVSRLSRDSTRMWR